MFERETLQYMIFISMKSTAPIYSEVPLGASLKIKLLGFVHADNSIEACQVAVNKYNLEQSDLALLSACLIEVYDTTQSLVIHKHSTEDGIVPYHLGRISDEAYKELKQS